MIGSIKYSIVLYLLVCVGTLSAQTNFDPETGLPIEPEEAVQYDPVTGEKLDMIEESTLIDPETGLPLRPAIVTEPQMLEADEVRPAQPAAPGVVPVVRTSDSGRNNLRRLARSNARLHNPTKVWQLPAGMTNTGGIGLGAFTGAVIGGVMDIGFLGFIIGGVAGSTVAMNSLDKTVKHVPVPEQVANKSKREVEVYKKAYQTEAKRVRKQAAWTGTYMIAGYTLGAILLTGMLLM